jgi:hypothetical protein
VCVAGLVIFGLFDRFDHSLQHALILPLATNPLLWGMWNVRIPASQPARPQGGPSLNRTPFRGEFLQRSADPTRPRPPEVLVERRISVSKNHRLQPLGYVTAASSRPLQCDRQGSR